MQHLSTWLDNLHLFVKRHPLYCRFIYAHYLRDCNTKLASCEHCICRPMFRQNSDKMWRSALEAQLHNCTGCDDNETKSSQCKAQDKDLFQLLNGSRLFVEFFLLVLHFTLQLILGLTQLHHLTTKRRQLTQFWTEKYEYYYYYYYYCYSHLTASCQGRSG